MGKRMNFAGGEQNGLIVVGFENKKAMHQLKPKEKVRGLKYIG